MNAEFNVWLLLVGLVVGAGLVYLVLADTRRREDDVDERERALEATWIVESLETTGQPLTSETVEDVLRLHRTYLASLPPDEESWPSPDDMAGDAALEPPPDPGRAREPARASDRIPTRDAPGPSAAPGSRISPVPARRGAPPPQEPGAGS